ncbi:MAG: hypothetical protein U0S50_10830 [Sphingopyxis sp.]|uniref:hypothetical protein n=1 Tax=Sphingopyxis sp. TaxID=1908224 RepID=UPI002ABC3D97|nr:hypothetical protein [Sphingopyxis sp.]MDZ3832300.1 hypothetical protein [Sphingopyxis sp.]
MTAQIRPNRMEVSDRFPMIGFAIKSDVSGVEAEVVLASDIALFKAENRSMRSAANFYSSREHGLLQVPNGEGIFALPPEVLARFIGQDRLFFGLATGRVGNGGLSVDALPREGSPYVSLRSFSGRTLRRSFGARAAPRPPVLDWAGDTARPGGEPATSRPAAGANGASPPATTGAGTGAGYDDGFGPMPDIPAREARFDRGMSADPAEGPAIVAPPLADGARGRANRIGGQFGTRIGEALDLGLAEKSLTALLDTLDPGATPQPLSYAKADANGQAILAPAPPPRARAMDGGASAAIAVAGLVISQLSSSRGDVTWTLDQLRSIKHPNNIEPSGAPAFRDAPTIRLDDWPVSGGLVDDISAWFAVDWQYNGRSLGNVRISNIGVNDAVGWGLEVRAEIMDDDIIHQPGDCAALRIRFSYRFTRTIGADILAYREVRLFGNGTHAISGDWIQHSALALADGGDEPLRPPAPQPRARAMEGGVGNAIDVAGMVIEQVASSQGDVTWTLEQSRGLKHPGGSAPSPLPPVRDAPTIRLNDWPVSGGLVDDISAWFAIDWQCNGQSLGNVRISNIGVNDAVGWGLDVRAEIMDDSIIYDGNVAALRIRFSYRFTRTIGADILAYREVHLFGNGTHAISGDWIQHSALSLADTNGQAILAPAPPPRARAMDGGASAAIAVAGLVISQLSSSRGDVTWTLDQLRSIKHPNNIEPSGAPAFRDAPTIRLDDWPVSGGLVDDISAWFAVDWQYNGRSLGNVRISNIGVNDAVGWGLEVRAEIMDDDIIHQPGNCAALRIRFSYRFTRTIGSDILAYREVRLFGNGTHAISGDWIQHSALALADGNEEPLRPPAPQPRARAMDGEGGGSGAGTAIKIAGMVISQLSSSQGDVTWTLEQSRGLKHPGGSAPSPLPPVRDAPTIRLNDWPVSGGLVDDISAWFAIDWQCNGQSLGNVRISNIGVNDAVGWGLDVRAEIMDDSIIYEGNVAALRIRFSYRFTRTIGADILAYREVHLFGNGTHAISGDWIQHSALSLADAR